MQVSSSEENNVSKQKDELN